MRLQAPEANLVDQPLEAVLILPRGSASRSAGGLIISARSRRIEGRFELLKPNQFEQILGGCCETAGWTASVGHCRFD